MQLAHSLDQYGATLRQWLTPARVAATVIFALLVCGAQAQTGATWNTIGPAGGTVSALLTSPMSASTLYAGTPENGVFISTDAGLTWNAANTGLPATAIGRQTLRTVYALATDGQVVYAATAAGVYYANAGAPVPSWAALTATAASTPITMLAFEPNTSRLFAATGQTDGLATPGVYVTPVSAMAAPATATWAFAEVLSTPGATIGAMAMVPAQGALTPASLLVGAGGKVYAASIAPTSTSLNWVDADPSATLAFGTVTALTYSPDFVQAYACSSGSVYYSSDPLNQAPWTPTSVPASSAAALNCNAMVSVPLASGVAAVVLGTDQGAFVSTDSTSFFATGSLGAGASANAVAVGAASGSSMLFVGAGFGVASVGLTSLAAQSPWAQSNGPASIAAGGSNLRLNNASIVDTAVIGTTLYGAAVSNQVVEVFSSSDGGATWAATNVRSVLNPGEEIISLAADATNTVLYAATSQGLLAYKPSGAVWSAVGASVIAGRAGALALGTATLFVGADNGVFAIPRTAAPASATPLAAGLTGSSVRSLLVAGGNVYAGTIDSTDNNFVSSAAESMVAAGTAVWAPFAMASSAGTSRITSLLLVGDTLLAATNGNLLLYASSGSGWASANTSADPAQQISDAFGAVTSLYSDGNLIYAATGSNGVFVSSASGAFAWTAFNGAGDTALPSLEVHSLRADGTTVYAATRAGIASFGGANGTPPSGGPPPTPTPTPTPSSSSGGGAVDPIFAILLLCGVWALRRALRR